MELLMSRWQEEKLQELHSQAVESMPEPSGTFANFLAARNQTDEIDPYRGSRRRDERQQCASDLFEGFPIKDEHLFLAAQYALDAEALQQRNRSLSLIGDNNEVDRKELSIAVERNMINALGELGYSDYYQAASDAKRDCLNDKHQEASFEIKLVNSEDDYPMVNNSFVKPENVRNARKQLEEQRNGGDKTQAKDRRSLYVVVRHDINSQPWKVKDILFGYLTENDWDGGSKRDQRAPLKESSRSKLVKIYDRQ